MRKTPHGHRDAAADHVPVFRRVQLSSSSRLMIEPASKRTACTPGLSQHDEFVVTIDTGPPRSAAVLVAAHDGLAILPGILQAQALHFPGQQFGEREAGLKSGLPWETNTE